VLSRKKGTCYTRAARHSLALQVLDVDSGDSHPKKIFGEFDNAQD
jgi:hypothetical protein